MGGDTGSVVTVPATVHFAQKNPDHDFVLVGLEKELTQRLGSHKPSNVSVHGATQIVTMSEPPAQALRQKKDSSMRVAVNLVRDGTAAACVSAGNTGALMATARFVLKTVPGIERPAIVTRVPNMGSGSGSRGYCHVLDLGANVDSPANRLFQFGIMGSILMSAVDGVDQPRVALLNIGHEDIKGNDTIREAAQMMRESNLNFVGFIEGNDIFTGDIDVVVCDGFVGNVAIKTSEGLAEMISHILREEFTRGPLRKLAALCAYPVMKAFKRRVDHRRYNGASLVGLQGTVVKSHGGTDEVGFQHAIAVALNEVDGGVPSAIADGVRPILEQVSGL